MNKLSQIEPKNVFKYFEQITAIPHGSGDMEKISEYCMEFAKKNSLKAVRDESNNVVIFKDGTKGYEDSEPVILQGHLDMVCQKTEQCDSDFQKDGLDIYIDGDFIKAHNTTLGADNGIAVAMIMAILESDNIAHPPIEAVFTTDEEIGMIGADALSVENLKGRKMINIDAEEKDTVTVSCAGGSDFKISIPVTTKKVQGTKAVLSIKGIKGGHSGIEIINDGLNADMLAGRILNHLIKVSDFDIISINGGNKGNAIPTSCTCELVAYNIDELVKEAKTYFEIIKQENSVREPNLCLALEIQKEGEYSSFGNELRDNLLYILTCAPNGVMSMSKEVLNLVETSLNLGILKTDEEKITILFTLRSNKKSALDFLREKLERLVLGIECETEISGYYPPWEFNENSKLQKVYKEAFIELFGYEPNTIAIHAGLECATFSSKIKGLDCIAIGPEMYDVHTINERLSISSTKETYELILALLKMCK